MKLYLSDEHVTVNDLWKAAQAAEMYLSDEHQHGSRYADAHKVIEFNGYGSSKIHSSRRPNTRNPHVRRNYYAATWDQWGVLLSLMFEHDPGMWVGGYKRPTYDGMSNFDYLTDGRFDRVTNIRDIEDFHGDHTWRFWQVGAQKCTKCSAVRRFKMG